MKNALIVDDDASVRTEISSGLEGCGLTSSGISLSKAAEAFSGEPLIGCAFVFLPLEADDFAALAEKARIAAPGCLIIALADLDRKTELKDSVTSGVADDFLPLPFTPSDLRFLCKLAKERPT